MRFMTLGILVALMAAVLATAQITAQQETDSQAESIPRFIRFRGVLQGADGKPPSGTVGVTFTMYKDHEGSGALWIETQNVTLDQQGRYTVLLGANSAEGLPLELFMANEARWLGVQVLLPGEVEQPRVLLVSVPYALKAADAETLGGMPASAFVLAQPTGTAPGTVTNTSSTAATRTTSTRAGKAKASGAGPKAAAAAGPIAANFIPVFTDNSGTLGSSAMLQSGSNIGIGTTTPGATLDVNGGARALSYQFSGNAAPPTDPTATILNQAFVGPVFSGLSFKVRTGSPTPADALSIDQAQNVSIAGSAGALAYKFTGNAAPPTDTTATILNQAFVGPVFSGLSFRVRTGAPAPADALTVDQNQRVGIGTTSPGSKLEVAGNLAISGGGSGIRFPDGTLQTTAATGTQLAFTVTLPAGTFIASGTCIEQGLAAAGATTAMTAVISPAGDPSATGLNEVIWSAFVDASDHVKAQFCHFSKATASASSNQVFNIRVIQ